MFVLQKKSVNRKPFLVRTIFPPTKIFSAVTKLQSCRREDLEAYNFLSGDKILCSFTAILRRVILFGVSQMRTRLQKQKIGDYKIFTFLANVCRSANMALSLLVKFLRCGHPDIISPRVLFFVLSLFWKFLPKANFVCFSF